MATNSPKKTQRVRPKAYSTCLLYNTKEAQGKLSGLSLANCNPNLKSKVQAVVTQEVEEIAVPVPEPLQLTVSDKMSCNYCDAVFAHRVEQVDWHRYNQKLRLKGKDKVSEEQFEDISGNISSLSGSDSDSDVDTDTDNQSRIGSGEKLPGYPRRLLYSGNTSTDSDSESGNQSEDIARRLPKVYFRNKDGDLLSIHRCVLCHKKVCQFDPGNYVFHDVGVPEKISFNYDGVSVVVQYQSEDGTRNTFVTLVCNPGATEPSLDVEGEKTPKNYYMTLTSVAACPVSTPYEPTKQGDERLSTGSILLIIFFVLLFVYLVIGITFNKVWRDSGGIEIIPNIGFWKDLAGLVRDGCALSMATVCRKRTVYVTM